MTKFRSTLLVVATAFVAAACGDKVTVAGPATATTATPKVNSVSVAPATATMNIGDVITLSAAVNADAGLATTVTWASSDASKASVDASGKVTGVAGTPGVAICATSTVDTGKKGCASVIVTGAAAIVPATVSIASVTVGGGSLNTPVNPAAVVGIIDVKLNIAPGNQTPTRVDLLVGTTVVATQGFTATQAAALRSAADEAVAAQSAFPSVVLSYNTATFNATTGAPAFANGTFTLGAKLYTTQGGSTAAAANATTSLTFANADGFVLNTTAYTANTANDGTGYKWSRIVDSTAYTLIPVSYSGKTATAVTLKPECGTSAANLNVAAAPFRYVLTAAVAAGYQTTNGGTCPATATTTTGEQPSIAGATYSDGSSFNGGTYTILNLAATPTYRWDHVAPVAVAGSTFFGLNVNIRLNVNPNSRANRWINDAVAFNTGATTATSNGYLCNASAAGFNTCAAVDTLPRDAGVGGTVYSVQVGATKAAAYAAAPLTSAATLAQTATNAGYCAIAFATDALGNKTSLTATQQGTACGTEANNAFIGVDRTPPTIIYQGGIGANARIATATVASNFSVFVNDTGLVGNSGMLPTAPVRMSLSRRTAGAANSAGTTTLLSADTLAVVTGVSATGVVSAGAGVYTTAISTYGTLPMFGYWTHSATAFDAAGNSVSITTPRVMVYDNTAPVVGAPSVPLTVSAIGYNATSLVNEDLDIQDTYATVTYTGAAVLAPAVIQIAPATVVNSYNAPTFSNTNFTVNQPINLPLAIQANVAGGLQNVTGLTMTVRSQSNLATTSGSTVPVTITPGTAISTTNMTTYPAVALPAGVTGVVTGNTTAAVAATPASATLTANINGTTAIFNNPFSRVDFYMLDQTAGKYFLVGSSSTAVLNDNGATRTFSYSVTVNGATLYTLLGGVGATFGSQVIAVAMNASGNIGMVSAALTALNIVF